MDRSRSLLRKKGFIFEPFSVPARGLPLAGVRMPADTELIRFSRGGQSRALLAREMAYHHVAQGELAGHRYLISF
jgi:hypothetical protein